VNKSLDRLLGYFDRHSLRREVEEELQFHIEMQARDYERKGLTPEESLAKARVRFGDFARIKTQCVQVTLRNSARTRVSKLLFTMVLVLGVLVRSSSSEFRLVQIGNILIGIAVLGGLLLLGKRIGRFKPERNAIRLGLNE
jgi:hypothetical protein